MKSLFKACSIQVGAITQNCGQHLAQYADTLLNELCSDGDQQLSRVAIGLGMEIKILANAD